MCAINKGNTKGLLDKPRYYVHRFRSHNSDSDTSIRIFSSLSIKSDHAFHTFLNDKVQTIPRVAAATFAATSAIM